MREALSRARRWFSKQWPRPTIVTLGSECRFGDPIQVLQIPPDELAEDAWQVLLSEANWRMKLECENWDRMDPFVIAASKRSALRQLFPQVSLHGYAKFSRCTA